MAEAYEELSDQMEGRWKNLIGWGCGYFVSWKVRGDEVVVTYERPCRQGGGHDQDVIPLACFEEENEDKAKEMLKEAMKDT
jgi:hypothetical protein